MILNTFFFVVFVLGVTTGVTKGSSFVVYCPDTLFRYANSPVNLTQEFEQSQGLPPGTVKLVQVPDTQLQGLITSPLTTDVPDVVIGIDNIHQYGLPKHTFLPANSSQIQFVYPNLYAQVSEFNLFPYEYGDIALIGNTARIGVKFDPSRLTLENLAISPDILRTLILQHPETSATGAAFLLSVIAAYPRSDVNIGALPNNWTAWWSNVLQYATVVPTRAEAIELFESNDTYTLMIGHELDPLYFSVTKKQYTYIKIDLNNNMWHFVNSLGVYNKTANATLAQNFVDFFLSQPFQRSLKLREWMYPARENATDDIGNPDFTQILNATTVSQNLGNWISEWKKIPVLPPPKPSSISTSTSGATSYFAGELLALLSIFVSFFI